MPDIVSREQRLFSIEVVKHLAILERNRQMVDIGAYESGSNPALDHALALESKLLEWMRQNEGGVSMQHGLESLSQIIGGSSGLNTTRGQK